MKTIHQQIIKEIETFLKPYKKDYIKQCFDYEIIDYWSDDSLYQVEVYGYYKDEYNPEKQANCILLRLFINYEYGQILISNIFLPDFMRYKGIGKKLIFNLFVISEKETYELFLIDMVESFYQRMIKRSALPCENCNDAVQIVSETKLF